MFTLCDNVMSIMYKGNKKIRYIIFQKIKNGSDTRIHLSKKRTNVNENREKYLKRTFRRSTMI